MKEPILGPAWEAWEEYRQFSESVKTELRFVRSERTENFLQEVLASCEHRRRSITRDKVLWRARLGCEEEEITTEEDDLTVAHSEDRPFSATNMKPIRNWQSEGRANPRGIPYLYLATDKETALAEVRPWIDATISVAQLKMQRDLSLIDCSQHHSKTSLFDIILDKGRSREEGLWAAIDQAFATPVSKDDESKDYVPTQIIAELFKSNGFDGIVYKSLLTETGFNVVLFNLSDAEVAYCALYKAASIQYSFIKGASEYFLAPR